MQNRTINHNKVPNGHLIYDILRNGICAGKYYCIVDEIGFKRNYQIKLSKTEHVCRDNVFLIFFDQIQEC